MGDGGDSMPVKRCSAPGCVALVPVGQRNCDNHTIKWLGSGGGRVIKGDDLRKARAALFARQPICCRCNRALSAIRDHIVPLAAGGADVVQNTQGLCKPCDKEKTDEDRRIYGF